MVQFKRNPYYQTFCGQTEFSLDLPCDSTELIHFRKRIGGKGFEKKFQVSVGLHGKAALEATVTIDTTIQEKAITYPTDAKLAIKVINRLNKLAKHYGIQQRRKDFLFYERVLEQQPKDKNKIYSLHEPDVYCIGKGKDHKQYEYGNKVSLASTAKSNIIVGVASHERNIHDNHSLPEVLAHIESSRGPGVKQAVCDRGYRGKKKFGETDVILPAPPLKKDNCYQRDKKRKRCQRRAAIEPIIGHLKTDFRLTRNFLKGIAGDSINLLMAACAWNMAKCMREAVLFLFALVFSLKITLRGVKTKHIQCLKLLKVFLENLAALKSLPYGLFQG